MSGEQHEPVFGSDQPARAAGREHYFHGLQERSVDFKGRFNFPARFRRGDIESEKYAVVLGPDGILTIHPHAEWQKKLPQLYDLAAAKKQRGWYRRQSADSEELTPDEQGRVMVPRRLLEAAHIKSKVLVVGMGKFLELWDPQRYAAAGEKVPPPDDDFIEEFYR